MITLCSIFRNSESYVDRYFDQIKELRQEVDVRLVLADGDCEDLTGMLIRGRLEKGDTVTTINHNGPVFGSIDHPQRWDQIGHVVRGVLKRVGDPGDAFVWVESDLLWDAATMTDLLHAAMSAGMCVAPMCFAKPDPTRLYDTWGARQNGKMFLSHPPYFPEGPPATRYVPIDSCGSCFVVPGEHFDVLGFWNGIWPFTADNRLFMDSESAVYHP